MRLLNIKKYTTKVVNKLKEKKAKVYVTTCTFATTLLLQTNTVSAAGSNTDSIDGFINFLKDWVWKIGGLVAFIGGIMFAVSFQRDDAEGKTRALFTMMGGFMLVALSSSMNIFGL